MRLPLEASAAFWWKDSAGTYQEGRGRIRDITERGAFIFAAVCPPHNANVDLRIVFDALPGAKTVLRMEVQGRVVRVERTSMSQANDGFAIETKHAMLKENGEDQNKDEYGRS
jgi:hypothetical protein